MNLLYEILPQKYRKTVLLLSFCFAVGLLFIIYFSAQKKIDEVSTKNILHTSQGKQNTKDEDKASSEDFEVTVLESRPMTDEEYEEFMAEDEERESREAYEEYLNSLEL